MTHNYKTRLSPVPPWQGGVTCDEAPVKQGPRASRRVAPPTTPPTYVALLMVFLSACALNTTEGPPVRWHADARFTPEERTAIVAGADWLSKNSGHDVGRIVFDGHPGNIRRERGPEGTGQCLHGAVYLGLDDANVRDVDVPGFAAHELAHCELGLVDDPESEGLMRVIEPMKWTDREAAQCVRLGC